MNRPAIEFNRKKLAALAVPAAMLAIVAGLWWFIEARRPPTDDTADGPLAASPQLPGDEVRLDRDDLRRVAGIEVEPAQSRPVKSTITCNGSASFNLNTYVKIPPKADGVLRSINVDVGSRVSAGDVLAVVNSQPFGDMKADYIKALIHEEHLHWQVDKYLAAGEGVAAQKLFEARHLLEEQQTDTARIKERLINFGLSQQQIADLVASKDISVQLEVIAPREGTVVQRHAVEGEPVDRQTPLFAIADLRSMWVQLNVYESHLPHIQLGQSITFFPDGLPGQNFTGAVTWISPEVNPKTRTIPVRTEVVNRDGALLANMFGKGELPVDETQKRVLVPQAAVQTHQGKHVVFVQKTPRAFEVRRIVVGLKDDRFWEVTAGLEPGEKVATTGSFLLKSNLENPDFGHKIE